MQDVRARLLEEGREARNLIAYSLPLQDSSSSSSSSVDQLLISETDKTVEKSSTTSTKAPRKTSQQFPHDESSINPQILLLDGIAFGGFLTVYTLFIK